MMMERVGDRKKWKNIARQAKAHSGLQCQWKKKKKYNFYCCTVHSEIHIVHSPKNALFIKFGKV
jgi:carboxylesterase type B